MSKDPDMVHNVANNVKYAKVKGQMSADLMKKLKDAHDPRVSDNVIFEKPPYTNGPKEKSPEPRLVKP